MRERSRDRANARPTEDVPCLAEDFRQILAAETFPCVGAKSALRRGNVVIRVYGALGSSDTTDRLACDLQQFASATPRDTQQFSSFVACFAGPAPAHETAFERMLWAQLQQLSRSDSEPWDTAVSCDPTASDFSFSFGGRAFFVVGLHARSSRIARRFRCPVLVFNPHDQFERLRREGKYRRMQAVIRARDVALQGSVNPVLTDFGRNSEARQYSGRQVEHDWTCPFRTEPEAELR